MLQTSFLSKGHQPAKTRQVSNNPAGIVPTADHLSQGVLRPCNAIVRSPGLENPNRSINATPQQYRPECLDPKIHCYSSNTEHRLPYELITHLHLHVVLQGITQRKVDVVIVITNTGPVLHRCLQSNYEQFYC